MKPLVSCVSYDIHRIFDFTTAGMIAPNRIVFGCGAIDKIGEETAKLARIATAMGEQTDALSELQAAKMAVDLIFHLSEGIGLPATLRQYGAVAESDLTGAAEMMIEKYPRPGNPRPMDRQEAIRFWRNMWRGNLSF